jgi:hypothetical protein
MPKKVITENTFFLISILFTKVHMGPGTKPITTVS